MLRLLTLGFLITMTPVSFAAAEEDPGPFGSSPVDGVLLEKGTRTPLGGVNVFILPYKFKTTTDEKGKFHFDAVPVGEIQWVVNLTGYDRLELGDQIPGQLKTLYLQKTSYLTPFETTVYGKGDRRDDTTRSLKAAQFSKLPGAAGDPIKAVQNLPGVNRARGGNARVIIQGAAPQDTRYLIDGHEVPIIFHFGGLSSVVFPEAIERVDYHSAGFGPENGRAIGGLIGVWTRSPKKDRIHGLAFTDLGNSGLLLEGPVGEKSGFMLGARKSYIGEFLKVLAKGGANFDLTVAPSFSDTVAQYETQLTPIDDFKILGVGSVDQLGFLLKNPVESDPKIRGTFDNKTAFFRLIPQLTHRHSQSTISRYSLGVGKDWIRVKITDNYFFLQNVALTARGELERKFNENWTSFWGFDNRYNFSKVEINLPVVYSTGGVSNPFSVGETQNYTITNRASQLALFWRNQITPQGSPWTLSPNIRGSYFSSTNEILPEPRAAIRYALAPYNALRTSGGVYQQPP